MTPGDADPVTAAGAAADVVNAVAGGGSLISFPALLAAGYPSVTVDGLFAVEGGWCASVSGPVLRLERRPPGSAGAQQAVSGGRRPGTGR